MPTSKKPKKHQALTRRKPRQERALDKVELIFQATMALIEQSGIERLTTNAIAEKAGVSIGTLYQYFADKNTILDALIGLEMTRLAERVMKAFEGAAPERPGARIPILMEAIMKSYGGRARIHRKLLAYALAQGPATRLDPLLAKVIALFASGNIALPGRSQLGSADAFVLTHAFMGVMRAVVAGREPPPLAEVQASLTSLLTDFALRSASRPG